MRITKVTTLLAIAFLAVATLGAASFARAQETPEELTDTQLRQLIATAKTPADHQKLAAYYREKAAQANAEAAEHDKMLAAYHENPGSHAVAKSVGGPAVHCQNLIRLFKDEAKQDLALAAEHEQMAKAAAQKQ